MRCEEIVELRVGALRGDLSREEQRALAAHLESCAGCAGEQGDAAGVWKLLDEWSPPPAPPLLADAVRSEIVRDLAAERKSVIWSPARLAAGIAAGIGLALLAVLLLPGRASLAEVSPSLLLSCAAFWAGVFAFASLLVLRPREPGMVDWRIVGMTGLLAMGGAMVLTRSCDVVTLVSACRRNPACAAAVTAIGVEGAYFLAGAAYSALPLFVAFLLVRGGSATRPVFQGLLAGALLFALLLPAILLQCAPFTAGLVVSWLAGTLAGGLVAGPAGSWIGARMSPARAG